MNMSKTLSKTTYFDMKKLLLVGLVFKQNNNCIVNSETAQKINNITKSAFSCEFDLMY